MCKISMNFFRNKTIQTLTAGHKLLLIGLWCMADNKGNVRRPYSADGYVEILEDLYQAGLIEYSNRASHTFIHINNYTENGEING